MDSDGKTVKIRCSTWDQVESFYTDKLRGNVLVVKMPFRPGIGESITVALGVPGGLVFAIDGTVVKIGGDDAGKTPVALRLFGLTQEVKTQLKRLVAQARGTGPAIVAPGARALGTHPPRARVPETVRPEPAPRADDVAEDERAAFSALAAVHRRILMLPAHEVLDVPADADAEHAHAGYLARCQKLHPDVFRRYRSPALRQLATEVFLHVRRALECMRGHRPREGWLAAVADAGTPEALAPPPDGTAEPIAAAGSSPYSEIQIVREAAGASQSYEDELTFTTSVRMKALTAEELFDDEPTVDAPAPSEPGADTIETAAPPPPAPPQPPPGPPELTPLPAALPLPPDAPAPTVELGREAMAEGRFRDACQTFAAILRAEPRNRQVRALYHVASGLELRAKGEGANALLQFETALAHDRECEEAKRALAHEPDKEKKGGGLFKRLFDR